MKIIIFMAVLGILLISGCATQRPPQPAVQPIQTPTTQPILTPSPTETIPSHTPIVIAGISVQIKNFQFNPQTLTISKGQTVTWTNLDNVQHTVTSTTGSFDSGPLSQGQTFSWTFNKTGTFEYSCTIHPSITHGNIIVGTPSGGTPTSTLPTSTPLITKTSSGGGY